MSELRVDSVKSKGGGAPDLPKGVTISGITTAATLGATTVDVSNVNVSGVVTSGTLSGSLLSTGTPTLGLGVTINSSGLVVTGVATAGIVSATTLYGDGTNLTGIAATLAPLFYNPDLSDSVVTFGTGIGITFNQQIKAGTGNITIRETNASGTVVENFGVGSSVTISENRVTFSPTSDLSEDTVYHVSYPSGCFTNNEGTDYVGTAYTFKTRLFTRELYVAGNNDSGGLGQNNRTNYSSPVQIPGTTWTSSSSGSYQNSAAVKTDGTLWVWGRNQHGQLAQNEQQSGGPGGYLSRSSPTQVPGTTWSKASSGAGHMLALKTDGTIWSWGYGINGQLGNNNNTQRSSPVQIPGTTWSDVHADEHNSYGIKTDGTLWSWGKASAGELGNNNKTKRSSPIQVPGTTWSKIKSSSEAVLALKTDGTLWAWGYNGYGSLGQNNRTDYSSPKQIPGTTWSVIDVGELSMAAIKTDGTLWSWGGGTYGQLGHNQGAPSCKYSSPVQVGSGSDWSDVAIDWKMNSYAIKTDGTLWGWGWNQYGDIGSNNTTKYSSPVQIGSETDWSWLSDGGYSGCFRGKRI